MRVCVQCSNEEFKTLCVVFPPLNTVTLFFCLADVKMRKFAYCKVVLATSLVWVMLDMFILLYFSECNKCDDKKERGLPGRDGVYGSKYKLTLFSVYLRACVDEQQGTGACLQHSWFLFLATPTKLHKKVHVVKSAKWLLKVFLVFWPRLMSINQGKARLSSSCHTIKYLVSTL